MHTIIFFLWVAVMGCACPDNVVAAPAAAACYPSWKRWIVLVLLPSCVWQLLHQALPVWRPSYVKRAAVAPTGLPLHWQHSQHSLCTALRCCTVLLVAAQEKQQAKALAACTFKACERTGASWDQMT
ncbi:hypothetical protein COO60DRAFT_1704547 [Scenedesmus sp. NREL 46B-D3]|nr:hypothetical protein COO60DRAFT_1704547 [Scenedesmus sp. NREL 46B-D3]